MRKLPKINFKKPVQVDIGCGTKIQKGYIGLDMRDVGQDIIWDVRDGLPFPDNSVDEIYTCHFLEHLAVDEDIEFFKEVFRVLKLGGLFRGYIPHADSFTAFFPGHKTFWNEYRIKSLQDSGVGYLKILENRKIHRDERVGDELYFSLERIK